MSAIDEIARQAFQQVFGVPMPDVTPAAKSTVKRTKPTLDDDQARAFQAFMIATGANGKSVGNGQVRQIGPQI